MTDDVVARRLVVTGRVQGVFFRAFVEERAQTRCVTGWAANVPDGSVEVWLEGPRVDVAAVERAVGQGPTHARVDAVDAEDVAPRGMTTFERR
jgi:acylphosphatase